MEGKKKENFRDAYFLILSVLLIIFGIGALHFIPPYIKINFLNILFKFFMIVLIFIGLLGLIDSLGGDWGRIGGEL